MSLLTSAATAFGPVYALSYHVSKNVQKADAPRVGFNTNFIRPVNRQPGVTNLRFGFFDAVLILSLIAGTIAVMRLLLAH